MEKKLSEEEANALGMRQTSIAVGLCTNCGGNVMSKWKYGQLDISCMACGFEPT